MPIKKLLIIFLFLTSCQSETPRHSSALNVNFQVGDVSSLSPHLLVDMRGRVLGKLLFEGLMRIDCQGRPQLAGAERVEISSDRTQYTFTLRKQFWSDGSQVTSNQYVDSWRYALQPATNAPRADLFYLIKNGQKAKKGEISIEQIGVSAPDPQTLVIQLEHSSAYFLHLLAQPLFAPLKAPTEEPTVFNGPFVIKKWEKGISLQLEPNTLFWNRSSVHLPQINISCVTDPMTALYLYEKGQIDWIGDPISPISNEATVQLREKGLALARPVDRFYWIYLNPSHPLLQSVKIRKALYLSINREEITKHIFQGAEPLLTPVHQSVIPYKPEQEDLERARCLFKEGLEELNIHNTPSFTLSYAQYANVKPLAEYLKNSWEEALGLTLQLQVNEWNVLRQNLEKGNFDVGGCFESAFYGDPLELLERFESLGNGNYCQWQNECFKQKLALIKKESDEKKQIELLIEAESILADETPFIPVFRAMHFYAHHPELKDYVFDATGCVDFAYARLNK